jgi:hypothetical protein
VKANWPSGLEKELSAPDIIPDSEVPGWSELLNIKGAGPLFPFIPNVGVAGLPHPCRSWGWSDRVGISLTGAVSE